MKSILKQLFDGTIDPMQDSFPSDPQYLSLWDQIDGEIQHLTQALPAEEHFRLSNLQDLFRAAYCMDIYEGFVQGFCLGSKLSWEVLNGQS